MSIAIRSKRLIASEHSTSLSSSSIVEPIYQDIEAPEQAELAREAPEMRDAGLLEAPDAGEGRLSLMEHEFTHGRSQS